MQAQKTQHTTTPAPYFLPLQQSSATSYFSLSSSHSATKQKRPQLAQQRENVATNSYFKTNNVSYSTKQKGIPVLRRNVPYFSFLEVESQSNSRLTALHSSLQQEAEKIRKWKNATELELKHKVIKGCELHIVLYLHFYSRKNVWVKLIRQLRLSENP